jgi:hypothetical protein
VPYPVVSVASCPAVLYLSTVTWSAPPLLAGGAVVVIGIAPTAPDATALAALALGYPGRQLGSRLQVLPETFASAAAEAAALQAGRIDAAYLPPASAVTAWTARRGSIVIISGTAASRNAGPSQPVTVLAVSRALLTSHPTWAEAILKAQVLANQLINTDRVEAVQAVTTELAVLGHKAQPQQVSAALGRYTYTCDPMTAAILSIASPAGVGTAGLIDLAPLNALLRAAGQLPTQG